MTGTATRLIARYVTHVCQENAMNKKDKQTMETHGITHASRDIYFYKNYKYDRLDDAVHYAKIDTGRARKIDGAL
jgi:hypothetical protein